MAKAQAPVPKAGKLARSQTLTVRLDPIVRFAAALAAASEGVTLSTFVERCVREATRTRQVKRNKDGGFVNALEVAAETWDPEESTRFFNLAFDAASLLSEEDQLVAQAASYFMTEVRILMRDEPIVELGDTAVSMPLYLVKPVYAKLRSATSDGSINYARITALAREELTKRGFKLASKR